MTAPRATVLISIIAALVLLPRQACAWQLWTASDGTSLSWNTTLQQTEAFRLEPANAALLLDPNGDDGDRHFRPGLISSRTDLFSEFDYSEQSFGARVSVAGWIDPVYLGRNDNDDAASFNPVSKPPGSFPDAVRTLHGLQADLLDAFVHGKFMIGTVPLTLRVGRHTLIWGESLFFGGNGIASAQAPTDVIRARSVPDATARETFLPVTQLSGSVRLGPGLSLEFYDQFEWRRDRLPGVESYFSTTDILDQGGERILLGGGSLRRTADATPDAFGQAGAALRAGDGLIDWGVYALQADARTPLVMVDRARGTYHLDFTGRSRILGASLSTFVGNDALAGELSFHQGVPVGVPGGLQASGSGPPPRADSVNAQVSLVSQLRPSRLWDSADLLAELAGNTVLQASHDAASVSAAGSTTMAAELQLVLHEFHVLPSIDLAPSATLAYGLLGRSGIDTEMVQGSGSLTLALNLDYRTVWHARLQWTHFIGAPSAQPLADRDFAAIDLARSF